MLVRSPSTRQEPIDRYTETVLQLSLSLVIDNMAFYES